jgi:hypothetical protein
MLYTEFIHKAIDLTIVEADNGLFYLEPLWRNVLHDNQLFFNDVSDFETEPSIVEDVLKLEVEKRNKINSVKPYVLNWIHEVISATVEPAILQEENDYIKNLTEYLKVNKEAQALKEKEDWDKFKST